MARMTATGLVAAIRSHLGSVDTTEISDAKILRELNEVMAEVVLEFEPTEARYDHTVSATVATGAGAYSLYAGTLRTYDGRNTTSGAPVKEIDEARYNMLKVSTSTGDPIYYCRIGTSAADPTVHQIYVWPTPTRTCSIIIPSLVMPTELTTSGTANGIRLNRVFDTLIQDIAVVRLLRGNRDYESAAAYAKLSEIDSRREMLRKRTRSRSTASGKILSRFSGMFR